MSQNDLGTLAPLYTDLYARLERLEKRYHTLETVLQTLSLGILAFSKEGKQIYCNRYARQLLALSDEDAVDYEKLFSDTYFGCSMQQLQQAPPSEQRLFLKLGEERDLEVVVSVGSEAITFLLYDRTESATLARSLQHNHQLQALGEMAAVLAHEIRNPLGGMEGFASLLQQELRDQAHREMAGAIITGSRVLNTLVTNVLEYAKPLDLHFQPSVLAHIVEESCLWSAGQACCTVRDATWTLPAERESLKRAFLHIIRNGWEASQHPVAVQVTTGCVTFTDQGSGILPKHLPQIFTPFFTTKAQGTGLGLSEAHKVIRAHGGNLEVTYTSSEGTQFTARFK